MKRNEIENKIHDRFAEMEEDVDVSKILAILPITAKKTKKTATALWIGGSTSLLILALTAYLWYSPTTGLSADMSSSTTSESIEKTNVISNIDDENDDPTEFNTSNQLERPLVMKAESSNQVGTLNVYVESQDRTTTGVNIFDSHASLNPEIAVLSDLNKDNNAAQRAGRQSVEKTSIKGNQTDNQSVIDLTLNKEINTNGNSINNEALSLQNMDSESKIGLLYQPFELEKSSFSNLSSNKVVETSIFALSLPKRVDCPTFGSNPWEFEFGSVLGLSNPTKSLAPKNNENIPAYPSRAINEKSLEGLDLELFLSAKRARWPVFIKSGINYSRWSERMKIDESYTEVDTVQGIISSTVSQSGDTITYIYGDIFIERDYQIKKSIHYFLHRFDIPISIVYEGYISENQSLQAELGTRVNFSTLANGRIYNDNLEFSSASLPSFFRRFSGLSYFTKLHYRYYLSEQRFIGASAYFQYLPADFSAVNNQIEQRYVNYGIGVYYGIRF